MQFICKVNFRYIAGDIVQKKQNKTTLITAVRYEEFSVEKILNVVESYTLIIEKTELWEKNRNFFFFFSKLSNEYFFKSRSKVAVGKKRKKKRVTFVNIIRINNLIILLFEATKIGSLNLLSYNEIYSKLHKKKPFFLFVLFFLKCLWSF